ncbi:MAG TPA: hypothetical protein VEK56_00385 [Vicinamibacterales bacterium]|nr:hypothetical protein [Vicinamibacterales bacterium]
MRATIRHTATAFTTGAAIALVVDALLQLLTNAIRVSGVTGPPWYARLAEDSVWIALGLVLWLASPLLGEWIDHVVPHAHVPRRTVWELVGLGLLTLPPGHILGQWIVLAMQLTIADAWGSEGRIFLSSAYYGSVLLAITPWMAAGAILRAWAHHMVVD